YLSAFYTLDTEEIEKQRPEVLTSILLRNNINDIHHLPLIMKKIPSLLQDNPQIRLSIERKTYKEIKEVFPIIEDRQSILMNYNLPLRHESAELFTSLCKEFIAYVEFFPLILRSVYAKHKEALNIIEGLSEGRYKISDNARSVSVEVYTMPDILSDANTIDEYIISPESQSYIIVSENMMIPLCTKCVDLCSTGIYREEGGDYRSIYCKACCSDDMKMDDCPICMTN